MSEAITHSTGAAPLYGVENGQTQPKTKDNAAVPEGYRAWLPALVVLIAMPVLALATTKYVLLPSFKQAFTTAQVAPRPLAAGLSSAPPCVVRLPINLSNDANTRSGFRGVVLVGVNSAFQEKINQNKAKLTTLASSALRGKTVSDLAKPGALDEVRGRLLVKFNKALGEEAVQDVYISEWPR